MTPGRIPDGSVEPNDSLAMMATPALWPSGRLLFLKRPKQSGDLPWDGELGVMLLSDRVPRTRVFLTYAFDQRLNLIGRDGGTHGVEFKDYDDFEAIVDDGWRVD